MSTRRYKIKKRYGLKDLPDGWHIYSRHIMPGKGRGLNYKRRRISGPYFSRGAANRAVKMLERKSRKAVRIMMRMGA
jgi:hypothetical protein